MDKRTNPLYFYCAVAPNLRFLAPFSHCFPNICSQTTLVCVTAVGWLTMFRTQPETQNYGLGCVPSHQNTKFGVYILICRQAVMIKMFRAILQSLQKNIESRHQIISYPLPFISLPVYSSLIRETFCAV